MEQMMKCPLCGTENKRTYHSEDVGLVEDHYVCRHCGYTEEMAYSPRYVSIDTFVADNGVWPSPERMWELAKAEKDGLIPPCKRGDVVYCIRHNPRTGYLVKALTVCSVTVWEPGQFSVFTTKEDILGQTAFFDSRRSRYGARSKGRWEVMDIISAAISHFEYGISHDIFKEPVTSYARAAVDALRAQQEPYCYIAEKDNPYPLCVGRGMKACAHCCLWADYAPGEDESRVNRPLSPYRLRQMIGEPVWICLINRSDESRWRIIKYSTEAGLHVEDEDSRCLYYGWDTYGKFWLSYHYKPEEGCGGQHD